MPKVTEPLRINPTVLRYRGLDLEALASIQMCNIEMLRRMSTLLFDSVEMVAARQTDFLKSTQDQAARLFEAGDAIPGSAEAFGERQAAIHRDLFESITKHAGELTEITARCCSGMVEQFVPEVFMPAVSQAEDKKPAKTSK
jgi:hypothetical protein